MTLWRTECIWCLTQHPWSKTTNSDQHISHVTSLYRSDGATDQLWCHDITHVRAWSSATHSPTLSRTNYMGPPTPTDTPSAIAAPMHTVNTHSSTGMQTLLIFKEMLTRCIRSPPAKMTGLAGWDGQAGQADVMEVTGGNNESAFAHITLHCGTFSSWLKAICFLSNLWVLTVRLVSKQIRGSQRSLLIEWVVQIHNMKLYFASGV